MGNLSRAEPELRMRKQRSPFLVRIYYNFWPSQPELDTEVLHPPGFRACKGTAFKKAEESASPMISNSLFVHK